MNRNNYDQLKLDQIYQPIYDFFSNMGLHINSERSKFIKNVIQRFIDGKVSSMKLASSICNDYSLYVHELEQKLNRFGNPDDRLFNIIQENYPDEFHDLLNIQQNGGLTQMQICVRDKLCGEPGNEIDMIDEVANVVNNIAANINLKKRTATQTRNLNNYHLSSSNDDTYFPSGKRATLDSISGGKRTRRRKPKTRRYRRKRSSKKY
jgi:hypothetical protein